MSCGGNEWNLMQGRIHRIERIRRRVVVAADRGNGAGVAPLPLLFVLVVVMVLLNNFMFVPVEAMSASDRVAARVAMTLRTVVDECREETGATEGDFDAMVRKEPAATMEAKCMRACLMKKFGLMDANGKFVRNVALQIASGHIYGDEVEKIQIAEEIVNICHNTPVSTNHCEAADQYSKCASEYAAARSFNLQNE